MCREFGVVIIEDDPYYYLQHDGTAADPEAAGAVGPTDPGAAGAVGPTAALEPCVEMRPADVWRGLGRSFLSLDVDGRVIRLDSFSKIVAPGFRLGWITAAPHVVGRAPARPEALQHPQHPQLQLLDCSSFCYGPIYSHTIPWSCRSALPWNSSPR